MSTAPEDWTIEAVDPRDDIASTLIARLTKELMERYHGDGTGNFQPADVLVPRSGFVIGRLGGRPVACGAYRPIDQDVAEIKRMYVESDFRGRGLSRRILDDLEARARSDGYTSVRLETGTMQPEAIRLYESAGYCRIEPYGHYHDSPCSICFEKRLT